MSKKRETTIYDIARELNVSPSTVSRALKGHPRIGKKTIKAVKELALKLGYRPNTIASSLRNNQTKTIGIIVSWINRPFISSLIAGIEDEINKAGYNAIITQSHDSYEHEINNANTLFNNRVAGLITSLAMKTNGFEHFRQYLNNDVPVVFVDRVAEEISANRVVIDNYKAGFEATEHLIKQGCKRIAHIGGEISRSLFQDRQNGYLEALKKYKLPVEEKLIINGNLSPEEGERNARILLQLEPRPDGIFCANDTSAVSTIQVAKKLGIKIPQDLAIIGFNNDPVSLIIEPQLSTVNHPAVEMGRISARQVLKAINLGIEDKVNNTETVTLETNILVRGSSKRTNDA